MSSTQNSCVLPENMLMEILSWLPLKEVVQLRCVSKAWNHLVSDPAFVKLHFQRSPKNTHLLLTFVDTADDGAQDRDYAVICPIQDLLDNPSSTLETLHRNNRPFNRSYTVLGVCNGLVCLQDSSTEEVFSEYWFRIWNPAIRAMSKDSPHIRFRNSDYKDISWFRFGFGYDEWSDTYQVVFLDNNKNESQTLEVRVWSLGDTCWRNTLTCDPVSTGYAYGSPRTFGIFVSATLNWLAFPKFYLDNSDGVKMNQLEIFSYHLKDETCRYFPMPDGILEVYVYGPEIEVLKGCLCLFHHYEYNLIIWLKREFNDEKSWSKLLTFSYQEYVNDEFPLELSIIWEDDEVLLLANTCIFKPRFLWYNTRYNRVDGDERYENDKWYLFSHEYAHSLVSPCMN
ncbi:F-box/kelch-repeat protein At3g23880-like [Vigna unguiculata]|uniref:F-box/kelch-repeat protein At3g23880-like n=1 Tax=Vigna unguiculata TaxID=3917 RepID=UPI001016F435|nr:F-box/kelch-repeat protein At3g23880-like [Vigna unguiculata]